MLGHGGSSAGSYLTDPTSPIPSHCAVIILFQSVPVHQLSQLALGKELRRVDVVSIMPLAQTLTVLVMTIDALQHFETG